MNWLQDIELEGENIKLTPLSFAHKEDLLKAASDGELWNLWFTSVPSADTVEDYINTALQQKEDGVGLPFVVIHKASEKIIGSTRYCNATPQHRRLEIGYTWYAKSYQRTGVNTACKYLLLQHAFGQLKCISVEFKTNWHNFKSRAAILRLGAKQEGVIRNHRINPDGTYRDSVLFSIIESEWGSVKKSLEYEMGKVR